MAANLMVTLDGDQIDEVKITDFGSAFNIAAEHTQVYCVGSLNRPAAASRIPRSTQRPTSVPVLSAAVVLSAATGAQ